MTDKKLTYKEIIKALECCFMEQQCNYCPLYKEHSADCLDIVLKNAHALITRQQAERENLKVENQSLRSAANSLKMHYEEAQAQIERLKDANNTFEKAFHIQEQNIKDWLPITVFNYEIKTEAYKEFAEKLKEFMHNKFKALDEYEFEYITERDIDNLVKEMVGDDNA